MVLTISGKESEWVLSYGRGIGLFVNMYTMNQTSDTYDPGKRTTRHGVVLYCKDYATLSGQTLSLAGNQIIGAVFNAPTGVFTEKCTMPESDIPSGFQEGADYEYVNERGVEKIRFNKPGIYAFSDVIYVVEGLVYKGYLGDLEEGVEYLYNDAPELLNGFTFIEPEGRQNKLLWHLTNRYWYQNTYVNDFSLDTISNGTIKTIQSEREHYIKYTIESYNLHTPAEIFASTSNTAGGYDRAYIVYASLAKPSQISYIRRVGGSQLFCYIEDGTVIPFQRVGKNLYGYGSTQLSGVDYGSYMMVSIDNGEQVKLCYWQKRHIYVPGGE